MQSDLISGQKIPILTLIMLIMIIDIREMKLFLIIAHQMGISKITFIVS